jgi:hypothetical protein
MANCKVTQVIEGLDNLEKMNKTIMMIESRILQRRAFGNCKHFF